MPSRVHPGKFYALPQAPQQFKQLLMVAGFDRYFQIAPCFRDEDGRADRSPGEFYQLDLEMSFVTQEDVFAASSRCCTASSRSSAGVRVTPPPFPRIPFDEAMMRYGTDKPDLRNPLAIADVTRRLPRARSSRCSRARSRRGASSAPSRRPGAADQPRSFFDKPERVGAARRASPGLGYVVVADGRAKGPIAKFLGRSNGARAARGHGRRRRRRRVLRVRRARAAPRARWPAAARPSSGEELGLLEKDAFRFCWIADFPMYERDEETGQIEFSHNPFSMPQGGLEALETQDPLTIKAYQYDIVCNGVELSTGAIRNHRPDIMYKAFEIAGYSAGGGRGALRRHAERVPLRRAAARRARRRASTASSCSSPTSRTSARSSPSR